MPQKMKNLFKRERNNDSDDEYVLISAIIGTVTHGNDTWLVDSGASKHMTGYKDYLTDLVEKESHQKVKLGDDYLIHSCLQGKKLDCGQTFQGGVTALGRRRNT